MLPPGSDPQAAAVAVDGNAVTVITSDCELHYAAAVMGSVDDFCQKFMLYTQSVQAPV
jgi:hypothetical protein